MLDEAGPAAGAICDVVGGEAGGKAGDTVGGRAAAMLGVKPPFDAGTGLPARPMWDLWDRDEHDGHDGHDDGNTLDPKEVHAHLTALARDEAARACVVGEWLLRGLAARVWEPLGLGSFHEYVERLFGWAPHYVSERLRVARALTELPAMREALFRGRVNWSVMKEVTRVAVPETEGAWLAAIEGKTVREVERMVGGRRPGDRPHDPPDRQPERTVLRFEVNPETRALLDEARAEITRVAGHHLSDDEVLQLMARAVLDGAAAANVRSKDGSKARSGDAGRANYQIHMTVCEKCSAGDLRGGGEEHRVRPEVVEAAQCDASVIEGPRGTKPDVGPGPASHMGRASQTISPAVRRAVVSRDKGRCSVPGCRHHHFVDVHHIKLRSEGGRNDPDNLVLLCSAHHQAVHDGRLVIRGTPAERLEFLHADGAPYGAPMPPVQARPAMAAMGNHRRAFGCLVGLGFRQGEARDALEAVKAEPTTVGAHPSTEDLVGAALKILTAGIRQCRDEGGGYAPENPCDGLGLAHPGHAYAAAAYRKHSCLWRKTPASSRVA